jgi:hypothetical protein
MNRVHLAGIIPLAGLETDYGIGVPDVMTLVEAGFTAIQKSIHECALAGCSTIWIVANQDLAPIVRKIVGEWTYDPVYYGRAKFGQGSEHRREIPIYYAPIHLKDVGRRDSYGWSILNGIYTAWRTANHISKWIVPNKYFVSFPMGVYDIYQIRECRSMISDRSNNFFLSHAGRTVLDNEPLPFTMTGEDYIQCRRSINKKTTREYYNTEEGEQYPSKKLPLEERWSAKTFDLSEVFEKLSTKGANITDLDWYYDISSWQEYRRYMGSDNFIKKPYEPLTKPHTHGIIPYKA